MNDNKRLEPLATKRLEYNEELYLLVDFLNKNLKDRNLIFGLTLEEDGKAVISIYDG
ncbi:MAG: YpmA family protein [Clostridia bacterium]|jgi:hypothetical protein|nr:YpmA family protein [Clostridiales bacterium]